MKHIVKIIENDMKNLNKDEREEFRNAILKSFLEITNTFDRRITTFEDKIVKSLNYKKEIVDIYIGLIPKDEYYLYEDRFFPMISKVLKKNTNLREMLEEKEVFLSLPWDKIESYNGKRLYGKIRGNTIDYTVEFELERSLDYEDRIKDLYDVFCLNNVKWKSVLNPYMKKVFKLKPVNLTDDELEIISKDVDYENKNLIEIFKEDLEEYWIDNCILCWNVREKDIIGEGIVTPTRDRIHLEHILNFNSNENIYIAPSEQYYIYNIDKLNEEQIMIVTEDVKDIIWKIYEILPINLEKIRKLKYKIFDNEMKVTFINRLKNDKSLRIRTQAEMERVLGSFAIFNEYFIFKSAKILTPSLEDGEKLYEVNKFILDEFRLKGQQQILELDVIKKIDDSYTLDILSFIVSELQLYFPEYRCIGKMSSIEREEI